MVPVLYGPRCPSPMSTAPSKEPKARQHARYLTALFRPWTFRDVGNADIATPAAWGTFWENLTGPRKQWALNVATLLRSDSKVREAVTLWRFSCARSVIDKQEHADASTEDETDALAAQFGADAEAVLELREDIAEEDPATVFLNGLQDALASFQFPEPPSVSSENSVSPESAAADFAARRKDLQTMQKLEAPDDAPLHRDALNANPFQPAEDVTLEDGIPQAPPQLDAAQKAVFDAIVGAVLVAKREPRLLLVHGGPRCGKSFVMRCARAALDRVAPGSLLAGATTGIAACNIGGQTISRLLLLYKSRLSKDDTGGLQELFEKIDGLFIDEMSMLRASDLALVEERLRIAKKSNEPFGGIAVILVGDFFQVMGVPLYSASAGRNSAAALGALAPSR
ncbi:ATP-dependent DNA helicase pfh1 [Diplonema papillatum]|nr:ATP-dependent DNA helicase pfh1 [Diplonema papillatum]KAJ9443728.1 ATP-dependent DNA helicase pfh1 [Diplonema papillatum]KAJ9443735.1 ATP-dependent DNA helicase pfh1 [Diplonema papillatum]